MYKCKNCDNIISDFDFMASNMYSRCSNCDKTLIWNFKAMGADKMGWGHSDEHIEVWKNFKKCMGVEEDMEKRVVLGDDFYLDESEVKEVLRQVDTVTLAEELISRPNYNDYVEDVVSDEPVMVSPDNIAVYFTCPKCKQDFDEDFDEFDEDGFLETSCGYCGEVFTVDLEG